METTDSVLQQISDLLNITLITTADAQLTLGQILFAILAVTAGFLVSRMIERMVIARLRARKASVSFATER